MEQVLASVILPVYNSKGFLKEAIDSILHQTFTNFELIIINDGSTDISEQIILAYTDNRIVYIKNEFNVGLIASLNKGISVSKGKYLVRMDADDISLSQRIKEQVNFMEKNPEVGVCGCDYIMFNERKEDSHKALKDHNEILAWMLFNSSVVHPSLVLRASVVKDQAVLFDKEYKHAEDYELWSRLIFKCKFSAVNETLFKYRSHSSQVSVTQHDSQIESADKVRRNILRNAGFNFSDEELRVHCLIGSSTLITSLADLELLEKWFDNLEAQNKISNAIDQAVFKKVLAKEWFDACGITNLGIKAFSIYWNSERIKDGGGNLIKLLVKCALRSGKKS